MSYFRTVLLGLIAVFVAINLEASDFVSADTIKKANTLKFIKRSGLKIKKGVDLGDIYMFEASHPKAKKLTIFITKDFKNIIAGRGYSSQGKALVLPVNIKKYKKEALWSVGNGKKEYYMFTDPQCPYCQMFEKNLKNLRKDVKLYVFLFPLGFHKDAKDMSRYVLSKTTSKDRIEAMLKIAKGSKEYKNVKYSEAEKNRLDKMVGRSVEIGNEVGVEGTPTVFNSSGEKISWPNLLTKRPTR